MCTLKGIFLLFWIFFLFISWLLGHETLRGGGGVVCEDLSECESVVSVCVCVSLVLCACCSSR